MPVVIMKCLSAIEMPQGQRLFINQVLIVHFLFIVVGNISPSYTEVRHHCLIVHFLFIVVGNISPSYTEVTPFC